MSRLEKEYYDLHYSYDVYIETGICDICSNTTHVLSIDNSEDIDNIEETSKIVRLCEDCIKRGFEEYN